MTGAIVNANQNTISSHQTLAQSKYYYDQDDHKELDQDYQQGLDQDENTRRCSAVTKLSHKAISIMTMTITKDLIKIINKD